jgi:hypothetical protein
MGPEPPPRRPKAKRMKLAESEDATKLRQNRLEGAKRYFRGSRVTPQIIAKICIPEYTLLKESILTEKALIQLKEERDAAKEGRIRKDHFEMNDLEELIKDTERDLEDIKRKIKYSKIYELLENLCFDRRSNERGFIVILRFNLKRLSTEHTPEQIFLITLKEYYAFANKNNPKDANTLDNLFLEINAIATTS